MTQGQYDQFKYAGVSTKKKERTVETISTVYRYKLYNNGSVERLHLDFQQMAQEYDI